MIIKTINSNFVSVKYFGFNLTVPKGSKSIFCDQDGNIFSSSADNYPTWDYDLKCWTHDYDSHSSSTLVGTCSISGDACESLKLLKGEVD